LLLITTLAMSDNSCVHLHGPAANEADRRRPDTVGLVFAIYGVFVFVELRSRPDRRVPGGPNNILLLFTACCSPGQRLGFSAGHYPLDGLSVAIWAGFASTNSMQQVRLVIAAPALASASCR